METLRYLMLVLLFVLSGFCASKTHDIITAANVGETYASVISFMVFVGFYGVLAWIGWTYLAKLQKRRGQRLR